MAGIGHRHFRPPAQGGGGDNEILKLPQFLDDQEIHDDARNQTAEIADDGQQEHEPGNGRPALKGGGTGGLSGGAPFFSREKLHRPGDDFFTGERRLLVENQIGHNVLFLPL